MKNDRSFTQYERRKPGVETELVIGFDFGTSSSKIVIQEPDSKECYAIPFPGIAPSGHDFLLPTRVYLRDSGEFSLAEGGRELTLLKNKLFSSAPHTTRSGAFNLKPEVAATAYLALALRLARQFFMKRYAAELAPGTILWSINVGLPEKYRQQHKTEALETCMLAAWELSVWSETVTVDLAEYWLDEIRRAKRTHDKPAYLEDEEKDLYPDAVVAIPEFVAQVQGYARSDMRRMGLHVMVDVGATTLDASTFTLFDHNHQDRYTVWEARVALLGAMSLHMHRLRGVSKALNSHIRGLIGHVDTVSPTPSRAEMVPELTEEDIYEIESDFADAAGILLAQMIADTHSNRNPEASEWLSGTRVFLCGGGHKIPFYKDRLERLPGANGCSGPYSWLAPFRFSELPKPDSLYAPGLVPSEYHRLAVAYGLSFRFEDVGKFEQGPEVDPNDGHTEKDWRDAYVGPEMT